MAMCSASWWKLLNGDFSDVEDNVHRWQQSILHTRYGTMRNFELSCRLKTLERESAENSKGGFMECAVQHVVGKPNGRVSTKA